MKLRDVLLGITNPGPSTWDALLSVTRFLVIHTTEPPFPSVPELPSNPSTRLALALAAMVQDGVVLPDTPFPEILPAQLFVGSIVDARHIREAIHLILTQDVPGSSAVLRSLLLRTPLTADDVADAFPVLDVTDAFDRRVADATFTTLPDRHNVSRRPARRLRPWVCVVPSQRSTPFFPTTFKATFGDDPEDATLDVHEAFCGCAQAVVDKESATGCHLSFQRTSCGTQGDFTKGAQGNST